MTALDYILDGLEAALELERELGVRTVEVDRGLLAPAPQAVASRPPPQVSAPSGTTAGLKTKDLGRETRTGLETRDARPAMGDLVFLHDRPLSPKGVEMMAKIIPAMGKTHGGEFADRGRAACAEEGEGSRRPGRTGAEALLPRDER